MYSDIVSVKTRLFDFFFFGISSSGGDIFDLYEVATGLSVVNNYMIIIYIDTTSAYFAGVF